MPTIPAVWVPLFSEIPVLEKGAGVPFLAMQENGHDAVLVRKKHRVYFQLIEVSSTLGPDPIESEVRKVMRDLYETWTGLLPEGEKPSFYGVVRGPLHTVDSVIYLHFGIGYTTYPVGGIEYGVDSKNREFCENNRLPRELIV